ncbi:MAG: hypothetical protein O3C43_16410 [Verrucomicrobia bacterium]|nr:hypothetical protein [Verrucomicrobiota bacterium]
MGYFHAANAIPGLNTHVSFIHLRFKNDSTNGNSSGSTVTGTYGYLESEDDVTGLVIDKCFNNGHNWTFNGPVTVTRSFGTTDISMHAATSSISNSVFRDIRLYAGNSSATNCVVTGGISGAASNTSFTNTIFLTTVGASWDADPSFTFCLNIGGSFLPAGNGNINGELVGTVLMASGSSDGYYQLKEGSPAIGAGFGGADIGAFGGSDPYMLSGLPGIPRMTRFNAPGTATGLTAVTIEVEAEAFPE